MLKNITSLTARIILSLVSLTIILVILELLLNLKNQKPDWVKYLSNNYTFKDWDVCGPYDPDTLLMPRNSICDKNLNNYSLRDTGQKSQIPKPQILFIGDSFTFGHGVNQESAYPAQIQKLLNENNLPGTALNAGIPGSGTDIQIAYFEKYIIPMIKPDIVVWNFQPNDLGFYGDNNFFCLYSVENHQLVKHPGWLNTRHLKYQSNSIMPNFILKTNLYWFILNHIPDRWSVGCSQNKQTDPAYFDEKTTLLAKKIIGLSRENNFRLIFTLIEGQNGYLPADKQKQNYQNQIQHDEGIINNLGIPVIRISDEVKNNMLNFKNQNNIPPLLTPDRETDARDLTDTLFLKNDGFEFGSVHMNETGNRLVAEVVFKFLKF